jgi:tRNA pseudouridine55 synthase
MQAKRFSNGGALDISRTALREKDPADKQIFRVRENTSGFLGLGICSKEKNQIKIYKLFK